MSSNHLSFEFREIACPVCRSNDARFLGFRGGEAHQNGAGVKTSIVRCNNCTHQYPNPMPFPTGELDDLYNDVTQYFQGHDIEAKKANGLNTMALFEKRLERKGRFLDVGCGMGELLWAAKDQGWDYEGIDPSQEFIEFGKEKLDVEGRIATLEEVGFDDESFDAIAMSSIVEHVYDPLGLLSEAYRILKPGGILFFDVPNEDGLYMRIGNLYMKLSGRDWVVVLAPTFEPFHVQGFNKRSTRELLKLSGFINYELNVAGRVWKQQGPMNTRKFIENAGAKMIDSIGRLLNMGVYIDVWAKKDS